VPRLSFKKANARRIDLIHKKHREGLTPEEQAEYERVAAFVGDWINKRHPIDDTHLREVLARLGLDWDEP
jgi:DNA gyrase/topoisomerase IV subunit A